MLLTMLDGETWSAQTARNGFPILVAQLRSGKTEITYGEWDAEIISQGLGQHVFLTQYGLPAGMIGNACAEYAKVLGIPIPPINLMIVNQKTRLPGDGAGFYIKQFCRHHLNRRVNPDKLSLRQKRAIIELAQKEIAAFAHWEKILDAYGLATVAPPKSAIKKRRQPNPAKWHTGPESEVHKQLKERIKTMPQLVGLPRSASGQTECRIWSGDRLDVYFPGVSLAIEVKTAEASYDELHRGIFQCIKYKAVLQAQQIHDRKIPIANCVLAICGTLSVELREIANLFGVSVFDNLTS